VLTALNCNSLAGMRQMPKRAIHILHRCREMADFGSNFSCRQLMPLFNSLVEAEPLNSGLRNFA